MRLVRITIEHFGSIQSAEVQFGAGLNVLYGPNDLGKSTLVEAVRLALLLPSTSTVHDAWVPWASAHKPTVDLTFAVSGIFWRVYKKFGPGNHATLHKSVDCTAWDHVAKGRAVDAKIREILLWGISEPGGASAPRGLPTSFLATALLSTQSDVSAVLAASLDGDANDAGKQRVAAALSALAQDPLFKKLIDATNERYDKAFTAQGRKSTAQGSVLKVAADRVRATRESRDAAMRLVEDSGAVESTWSRAVGHRDEAERHLKDAVDGLETLQCLQRWSVAKAEVDRIQGLSDAVARLTGTVATLEHTQDQLEAAVDAAEEAQVGAAAALRKAEDDAGSGAGDGAIAETVERQRLELAIVEAERRLEEATRKIADLTAARRRVEDAARTKAILSATRERAREAGELLATAQADDRALRAALARLDLVDRHLDLLEAEAIIAGMLTLRASISDAEGRAQRLRDARGTSVVPDRKQLAKIRALAGELAVARGKLEVGLAVTIAPISPRDISVGVDGGDLQAEHVTEPWTVEGRGNVEVLLHGVATVRVVAGNADGRNKAKALAARWAAEAAPVLSDAGVATADGLATRLDEAEALDRDLATVTKELDGLRAVLAAKSTESAQEAVAQARAAIGDTLGLAVDVAALGKDPRGALRTQRGALTRRVDGSKAASLATAAALHARETEQAEQKHAEAITLRDQAVAAHGDIEEAVVQAAATEASGVRDAVRAAIVGLDAGVKARRAAIEAATREAKQAADAALRNVDEARRKHQEAVATVANTMGRLDELHVQLAATDAGGAQARLHAAGAALRGPARDVTEEEIVKASFARDAKAAAFDQAASALDRAHGALEQVGGAVAQENLRDAEEVLKVAEQQERDVEADYDAWRMLRDQMVLAEAAQASHLGQALAPVVSERFAALTRARYGGIAMSAQLATEGILASGEIRGLDRLSVGTREQLSTLYRLCLAEHLKSALVLDDQLVQSDVARLDWFRALLREKARAFQIIVLTCRPGDYVGADALVPAGAAHLDIEAGLVRTVDLGRALRRLA